MKKLLVVAGVAAAFAAAPASALLMGPEGINYDLIETTTGNPLVHEFELIITRHNSAFDTRGGRTGINAIAFNKTDNFVTAAMITPPAGFQFVLGGLNAGGCNGTGNFFCFDNLSIPPVPTTPLALTPISFEFSITTSMVGSFIDYAPDFKIDWVGFRADGVTPINNYDNVSQTLVPRSPPPGDDPPGDDPPGQVPVPGTLALLGLGLLGVVGFVRRKQ